VQAFRGNIRLGLLRKLQQNGKDIRPRYACMIYAQACNTGWPIRSLHNRFCNREPW
jgi:hypothetical protein